jgi:hypothetical protein
MLTHTQSILYDQDYQLWLETTIAQLRCGDYTAVDWENLIEEMETVGRSERRSIESLLLRLLEHLLKLSYWQSEQERSAKHWRSEIVNFRYQIDKKLEDSPSLRPYIESIYPEVWQVALNSVSQLFPLGDVEIIPLEKALENNWFPATENPEKLC